MKTTLPCPGIHPRKPRIWVESAPSKVESRPAREAEWRCDKQAGHLGLCEHLTEMGGIVVWVPPGASPRTSTL